MPSAAAGPADIAESAASWRALGTLVRLVVTDPPALAQARELLEADLARIDLACSRFRPDSELCALRGGQTEHVSPLLAEAIAVALRAAQLTDGDVDPTVGAAMAALGYDRDFAQVPRTGPAAAPVTVRTVPGWRKVHLEDRRLRLPAGVRLDLGATAKAWAADRAAARIAERFGCGVLVSLGGDIAVAGPAPHDGWRIRVQDVTGSPDDPPDGPYTLIAIRDGGLATSSTTARRWQRGGDVLHHILDPRTSRPAESVWRTVSVAAGSCGRQCGQHRRGHPRPPRARLAGRPGPAVPAGRYDRRGVHRGRLARGNRAAALRAGSELASRLYGPRPPRMKNVDIETAPTRWERPT